MRMKNMAQLCGTTTRKNTDSAVWCLRAGVMWGTSQGWCGVGARMTPEAAMFTSEYRQGLHNPRCGHFSSHVNQGHLVNTVSTYFSTMWSEPNSCSAGH